MRTKYWIHGALVGLSGCTNPIDSSIEESAGATEEPLIYTEAATWDHTSISVCWKSSANATERGWVKQAVEAAFEGHTGLDFTGWGTCSSAGAYVAIDTSATNWPMVPFGSRPEPSAEANMFLNHFIGNPRDLDGDGNNDYTGGCWTGEASSTTPITGITGRQWASRHRHCIETVAIHEFFHIVGMDHEQNRDDTPGWCTANDDGWGDTEFGYWDATSVSNYCNPAWNGDGYLSQLDYAGLNLLYGWSSNDRVWYGIGNARDYGGVDRDQLLFEQHVEDHTGTYVVLVGDFNGSNTDDVFLYRPGSASDFIRYGRTDRSFEQNEYSVTGTYQPVAGDFDGDGADDIYWHAPGSAADKLWFSNGNRTFDSTTPEDVSGTYTKVLSGDFDGDERDDVLFYAAGATNEKILFGRSDRTFDSVTPSDVNGTYEPFTGNFDGDSEDDVFWYRPGESSDSIWFGNANRTFTSVSVSVDGTYKPAAGDFNQDGTSDVIWNRNWLADDPVWLFSPTTRAAHTNTRTSFMVGNPESGESAPFAGDFDGDEIGDVFWYKSN